MLSDKKIQSAYETLEKFSPNPANSAITQNNVSDNPEYDLQIVIPVYNCQDYIEECMDSVVNQKTEFKIKIIVINDGSTDSTSELLKKYKNFENIEIINQENRGYSGARNSGLANINSHYIMFVDSDDVIPEDAVNNLLKAGYEHDCDIVSGNYYKFVSRIDKNIKPQNLNDIYFGEDKNKVSGYPWMKIIKSENFKDIQYPLGFLFEDTMIKYLIASRCKKIGTISSLVYGYRQNPTSITNTFQSKPKRIDCYWITEQMIKDAFSLNIPDKQYLYEITLKQIWSNSGRTNNTPKDIKKSIFVLSCNLMQTYFKGFKTSSIVMKPLEIALKTGSYSLYKLYCETVSKYLDSKA